VQDQLADLQFQIDELTRRLAALTSHYTPHHLQHEATGQDRVNFHTIKRTVNNSYLELSGGNLAGSGGTIELYGGDHASFANQIIYDADKHTWRVQDGNPQLASLDNTIGLEIRAPTVETAQTLDSIRIGVVGGTPRIILEDSGNTIIELDNSAGIFRVFKAGVVLFQVASADPGVDATAITTLRINNGAVTNAAVTLGADDSGGVGFKLLRVPN
jgi:hypothetical protein